MRVDKIAKMLIGVENLVVQSVAVGAEGGAAWIRAGYGVMWSPRLIGWLVPNAE